MLKISLICLFPLIILLIQIVSPLIALFIGIVFLIAAIIFPSIRKIFLMFCIMVFGYLIWKYIAEDIYAISNLSADIIKILTRFGLLGYIILFTIWQLIQKHDNTFFKIGSSKEIIYFPFIWKGFKEKGWRFTLIFSLLWICIAVIFTVKNELASNIMLFGIVFSIINALLEELIWRGFVLSRLIEITNEKIALIVSSLAFGIYHYSLNFPLLICFVFAIGGFYFGGSAIKSKGLLSPIIMHFTVNLAFVSMGLIF